LIELYPNDFYQWACVAQQLHDDSECFSDISQDADIDISEDSDPDAEINRSDFSDSGGNSDDSHAGANVSNDDAGGGGDDNDEDDDNEDWALWDNMTTISVR
jgi:hypothetical protein